MVVWGENPLRCIAQDKKDLIVIVIFFPLYFDPHKCQKLRKCHILSQYNFKFHHNLP